MEDRVLNTTINQKRCDVKRGLKVNVIMKLINAKVVRKCPLIELDMHCFVGVHVI